MTVIGQDDYAISSGQRIYMFESFFHMYMIHIISVEN